MDMLSLKLVTSPPRKKSKIIFGSPINDSKDDEEQICPNNIEGKGGEKLDAIATQSIIEEEFKPNLDHVVDNIQI